MSASTRPFSEEVRRVWFERLTLRPGARGAPVVDVQRRLQRLQLWAPPDGEVRAGQRTKPDTPYGYFDAKTARAVATFQTNCGLRPDGIVGPATWRRLYGRTGVAADTMRPFARSATTTEHAGPKPGPPLHVHICVAEHTVTLYDAPRKADTRAAKARAFPVATGHPTSPTPAGVFVVTEIVFHPGGLFGTRWVRLRDEQARRTNFSIHGTNAPWTIGRAATPGCIRMYNKDIEWVAERIIPGTVVTVTPGLRWA